MAFTVAVTSSLSSACGGVDSSAHADLNSCQLKLGEQISLLADRDAALEALRRDASELVRARAGELAAVGDLSAAKTLLATWSTKLPTPELASDLVSVRAKIAKKRACDEPVRVDMGDLTLDRVRFNGKCIVVRSRYFFVLNTHSIAQSSATADIELLGMERQSMKMRKRLLRYNGSLRKIHITGVFSASGNAVDRLGTIDVHQLRM